MGIESCAPSETPCSTLIQGLRASRRRAPPSSSSFHTYADIILPLQHRTFKQWIHHHFFLWPPFTTNYRPSHLIRRQKKQRRGIMSNSDLQVDYFLTTLQIVANKKKTDLAVEIRGGENFSIKNGQEIIFFRGCS